MRINVQNRTAGRRGKRASAEAARTLSVASQMALLCPSGMDVWMQRELGAGFGLSPRGSTPKR
jgi:hypothetical protein